MYQTLVLNSDFQPISVFPLHTIPAQNAIKRVLNGTSRIVTEYDVYIKTPTAKLKWPSIIVRTKYAKKPYIANLNEEGLYYRDRKKCAYCGEHVSKSDISFDHYIPQAAGGKTSWDNILLSHKSCNNAKSDHMPEGKWKPKWLPWEPSYGDLLSIRQEYPITIEHESWRDFITGWKAPIILRGSN